MSLVTVRVVSSRQKLSLYCTVPDYRFAIEKSNETDPLIDWQMRRCHSAFDITITSMSSTSSTSQATTRHRLQVCAPLVRNKIALSVPTIPDGYSSKGYCLGLVTNTRGTHYTCNCVKLCLIFCRYPCNVNRLHGQAEKFHAQLGTLIIICP